MKKLITSLIIFFLLITCNLSANVLQVSNEFIKILTHSDSGRFIIKTTDGLPGLDTDNNALLLYEKDPPSSFTTIQINKKNYIFGDSPGTFEQVPVLRSDGTACIWTYNKIHITQRLKIIKGPTTGNRDTVEISYRVWNRSGSIKNIGMRIVFDTYLGKEDGAPFQIPGIGSVISERELKGNRIPLYWYSYDDLVRPTVRAQGTLKIEDLIMPNRIIIAGWHIFKKYPWDFKVQRGRNFKKSFLSGKDSAVGIFWRPRLLHPDDTIVFKTYYGLYGATVRASKLFNIALGGAITTTGEPFLVNVDIQNISGQDVTDVEIKLLLPKGLKFQYKKMNKKRIALMQSEDIQRASWNVVPDGSYIGTLSYKVQITATAGKRRRVTASREITILHPDEKIRKLNKKKEKIIAQIKKEDKDIQVKKTEKGVSIEFGDIYFKYKSALLTKEAMQQLNKVGRALKKYKQFSIIINGYTDNIGTKIYNLKLSKNRAKNVWNYLIYNKFINPEQAVYKGYGEENPITDNKTENGRKKNRRVEIIIIPE